MKIKNTLIAALAAIGLAQAASAVPATKYLYITGSTANGDVAHQAIIHVFQASGNTFNGVSCEGANLAGSKVAVISGSISGQPWQVKTYLTGSEAGIQATCIGLTLPFQADISVTGGTTNTGLTTGTESDTHAADVTFSDTFQSTSRFNGTVNGTNYTTLASVTGVATNGIIGVVPFKFIATSDAASKGITNLTTQVAYALWNSGYLPLNTFSGLAADHSKNVYVTGRNIDSGTRLTAMGVIGIGANTGVTQYQMSTSANGQITAAPTSTNNKVVKFPAATINGISQALGNAGYTSGGKMSAALAASSTNYGGTANLAAIIGYAGVTDCDPQMTNASNPLSELAYNGILLGCTNGNYNTNTLLTEGIYPFWTYEHLLLSSSANADTTGRLALANLIASQLYTTDSIVLYGNMAVSRTADGGSITY